MSQFTYEDDFLLLEAKDGRFALTVAREESHQGLCHLVALVDREAGVSSPEVALYTLAGGWEKRAQKRLNKLTDPSGPEAAVETLCR